MPSAETSRRLSCDAAVVEVVRGPGGSVVEVVRGPGGSELEVERGRDGSVLDVGRRSRTIPPALRRALEVRDRGCRFPGCGLRFTEGHHIVHWADGGTTGLDNLILLCRHHHRLVHEEGWAVHLAGRGRKKVPLFVDPRGGFHADRRAAPHRSAPVSDHPVRELVDDNRARGADPDGWSLWPRYTGEPGIPWELEAAALEALDEAHFGA